MSPVRCLLVAKSPVEGEAKTRLGAVIGMRAAAEVAAAALLDTIEVCSAVWEPADCVIAWTGDRGAAWRAEEISGALRGWSVVEQVGETFGERLANAHLAVADLGAGAVVQIGMDTPQVTAQLLRDTSAELETNDGVIGLADDGGWWVLGLNDPRNAQLLAGIEASTPTTGRDTLAGLTSRGLRVALAPRLRDVDTVQDAEAVAAISPPGRFAATWHAVGTECAEPVG